MTQRIQDTDVFIMMEAARAYAADARLTVLKPYFDHLLANGHSPQDAVDLLKAAVKETK